MGAAGELECPGGVRCEEALRLAVEQDHEDPERELRALLADC
mgnify:CR=1 FL=1